MRIYNKKARFILASVLNFQLLGSESNGIGMKQRGKSKI